MTARRLQLFERWELDHLARLLPGLRHCLRSWSSFPRHPGTLPAFLYKSGSSLAAEHVLARRSVSRIVRCSGCTLYRSLCTPSVQALRVVTFPQTHPAARQEWGCLICRALQARKRLQLPVSGDKRAASSRQLRRWPARRVSRTSCVRTQGLRSTRHRVKRARLKTLIKKECLLDQAARALVRSKSMTRRIRKFLPVDARMPSQHVYLELKREQETRVTPQISHSVVVRLKHVQTVQHGTRFAITAKGKGTLPKFAIQEKSSRAS